MPPSSNSSNATLGRPPAASGGRTGNVIAALASFFIPGLGQLVQGEVLLAAFFFVTTAVGYFFWWLIVPGILALVLHFWSVVDAARRPLD